MGKRKSNRKRKGILAIVLVFIIGLILWGGLDFELDFMKSLYGYKGYCSKVKLPSLFYIILTELAFTTLSIAIYIYAETFQLFKEKTSFGLKVFQFVLLANLAFLSYKVVEFPLLVVKSSTWGSSLTYDSGIYNRLFFFSIIGTVLLGGLTYRFRNILNNKKWSFAIYGFTFLLLLTQIVAVLSSEYESCFG